MKELKDYMFENELDLKGLAKLLGCTHTYLCSVMKGKYNAGARLCYKIEKLLGKGCVSKRNDKILSLKTKQKFQVSKTD